MVVLELIPSPFDNTCLLFNAAMANVDFKNYSSLHFTESTGDADLL